MKSMARLLTLPVLAALAALPGCDRATLGSGGGHGHDSAAHDTGDTGAHAHGPSDGPDPISVTLFTPKVLLFMEYPPLVQGEEAEFLAHFSVLATGEPVRDGSLTFEVTTQDGEPVNMTMNPTRRDGLFVPQWLPTSPGTYQLRLILDSPQVQDTLDVGTLLVHADIHGAEHAAEAAAGDEPSDLVPFLLEQQWKIGVLYETVAQRTLVHRLKIPGQIVAQQGASASVSPPVAGRLLPPPEGRLPRIGDMVEAGQILAMLEPPLPITELAQLSANQAWLQTLKLELAQRELELDTRGLEVEKSIIQSQARLDFARSAMDRVTRLREKGVGTEQQHDEAVQNLRLAEAEQQAARAMKQAYEDARRRLSVPQSPIPNPQSPIPNPQSPIPNRLPLRAPIAGKIVSVAHIEGEHLNDAHQEVFRIVNTDHIWVSAAVSEFDLARLTESPGASMTLPAYPGRRFDILGTQGGRLVNIGSIVDPQVRTVSIVYEMSNPDGLFRVGMFADVYLETQTATDAIAMSEDAIVLDNGRPIAYVLIDGENFQRRELDLGVRDGGWVEVRAGVAAGERVVTKGAYAIKLASLSPASFGHGHGH